MKIYLVNEYWYEERDILGAFDKKENAINFLIQYIYTKRQVSRYLIKILNKNYDLTNYDIEEVELE